MKLLRLVSEPDVPAGQFEGLVNMAGEYLRVGRYGVSLDDWGVLTPIERQALLEAAERLRCEDLVLIARALTDKKFAAGTLLPRSQPPSERRKAAIADAMSHPSEEMPGAPPAARPEGGTGERVAIGT